MRYVSLKNDYDLKVSSYITDIINAAFIYVPINDLKTLKIKSNDYVYKEQEIATNVFSPVSGTIVGIKECLNAHNKLVKTLVIKNDGKERFENPKLNKKSFKSYTKEEVISILNTFNLTKIVNILKKIKKSLIINGIEDEIYVANKVMILEKKTDLILETIDFLRQTFNLENTLLVLKNSDTNSISKIYNNVGRYPKIKIKLVPDYYGLEDNLNLQNYLFKENKNISVLDLNDLLVIYNLLKNNKLTTKKYITVSGVGVNSPKVINVKLGTSVIDVLKKVSLKKGKDYIVIINGLMTGRQIDITKLIVTEDLESIFIWKKENLKEDMCLNCGLCYDCCPRGINPKYIHEHQDIAKKYLDRCNGCNLCSYVCPSKIDLNPKGKD